MYDSIRADKATETESRLVVVGVGREEDWGKTAQWVVCAAASGGKNVLELDISDGCTTVKVLIPLNCGL